MRRMLTALATAALALALSVSAVAAGGPPSLSFYVDGEQYRTIGTPTDLSGTGAPDHTYDTIYALGEGLANVAEARPGDTDYNGGRWMVLPITWHTTPVQLRSAEQVQAAADAGLLTIGETPVTQFVCPVIRVPASH
jgi:hypothetical protein